jgi:hypothetical protein
MQFNIHEINKLVINLPERTDRLEQFNHEIRVINSEATVVYGVKDKNPMLGIAQAHLNCITYAKNHNWDKVLIMEDDVKFQAKELTLPYIDCAFERLPDKWDILLGGIYDTKGLTIYNEYWNKTQQFCGLHFYIVNSNIYDYILKYDGKQHIDRWLNFDNNLDCFVAAKFFATQYDGYSDNVNRVTEYGKFLKKFKIL